MGARLATGGKYGMESSNNRKYYLDIAAQENLKLNKKLLRICSPTTPQPLTPSPNFQIHGRPSHGRPRRVSRVVASAGC